MCPSALQYVLHMRGMCVEQGRVVHISVYTCVCSQACAGSLQAADIATVRSCVPGLCCM